MPHPKQRHPEWEPDGRPFEPYRALLGGSGVVQPGNSEEVGDLAGIRVARATVLNMSTDDMYACQTTVVLGTPKRVASAPVGAEQNTPPLFARVTYGVGGTQTELEIDWINGFSFNVPSSFLRLDVLLDFGQFPAGAPAIGELPRVNAPAFAGYYPVGQGRGPQRSLAIGDLAAATESALIPIPAQASCVELTTSSVPAVLPADVVIRQYADAAGTILLAEEAASLAGQAMLGLRPLVNGARYVAVESSAVLPGVRAVFCLSV